ncbi:MAG: PQQ-binding-like beta-propeller repeat protein, partial [Caldilineaceae bacterium]|nr:PQQ-binding-like beta-propeller repeat protein [Caldilineaceae bacterium]
MSQTTGSSAPPATGTPAPRALDLMRIFCPRCGRLTMQANCDGCGWLRPTPDTPSRYLHIQGASVKLEGDVTVLDGHFVVTSAEGELFLVDRYDLKVRAAKIMRMEGQVYHPTFTVAGDTARLYVGYNQSMQLGAGVSPVVAFSRPDLTEVWRCPTHGLKVSSPTLHAGVLYFAASNGEAWAVDAATGQRHWTRDIAGWSPEAPAVSGDVVVFPARGPEITALRRDDGQRLWTWTSAAESDWYPATPTIRQDRV